LMAVEQWFSVKLGKLFSRQFTGWWIFLVWHRGPFPLMRRLPYKRDSTSGAQPSNESQGERHSIWE
jgi:hypothetical protein